MRYVILLFLALLAWPAWADITAEDHTRLANGCSHVKLCDAEADTTAACDRAGSQNIVSTLAGRYAMTLYATQSDSTAFSCHLYSSDNGYHATRKQQITSVPLTTSQYVISVDGALDDVWIECSSITGGTTTYVTVTMLACPLSR